MKLRDSSVMGRCKDEVIMRKGPWMAEEDEILIDYVNKYGPRDWSSIRSKGLLPRTGKSCRLRWVNKLKPDLKSGCKFTVEEERVVIDLQAQFGNKWARIATYLPGRTDNDVKNLWSTRQKRLARILQTSSPPFKSQKNNGENPGFCEVPMLEAPRLGSIVIEEESCTKVQSCAPTYMGTSEVIKMVPLPYVGNTSLINMKANLPQVEFTPAEKKPRVESLLQFPFPPLQPQVDLSLLPDSQDIVTGFGDPNFLDFFGRREASEPKSGPYFPAGLPFFGFNESGQNGGRGDSVNPATPDCFLDDFPDDMFNYLEWSLPTS